MSERVDLQRDSVHRNKGLYSDQTTMKSLGTTEAMGEERKGTRDRDKPRSGAVEVTLGKSNPHVRIQGFSLRWRLTLISKEKISKNYMYTCAVNDRKNLNLRAIHVLGCNAGLSFLDVGLRPPANGG